MFRQYDATNGPDLMAGTGRPRCNSLPNPSATLAPTPAATPTSPLLAATGAGTPLGSVRLGAHGHRTAVSTTAFAGGWPWEGTAAS